MPQYHAAYSGILHSLPCRRTRPVAKRGPATTPASLCFPQGRRRNAPAPDFHAPGAAVLSAWPMTKMMLPRGFKYRMVSASTDLSMSSPLKTALVSSTSQPAAFPPASGLRFERIAAYSDVCARDKLPCVLPHLPVPGAILICTSCIHLMDSFLCQSPKEFLNEKTAEPDSVY